MALDYNSVQTALNVQNTELSKENKARAADSNVLSLVALLSDSVQEVQEGGKKGLGATNKGGKPNLTSSSGAGATEGAQATTYREGLKEIAQLLSKLLSELLDAAEKMQTVNNDLDKAGLKSAQESLKDAKTAETKNAEAVKQQAQAKFWGIFACIAIAIIGVVVSFATCGTTAGFVALALAVVLTTLTLTGVVQMVTDGIATDLEKDGCSSGLAKVLAAIIVCIIEVVLSAGTGAGASAIADGVSSSLTGAATEIASEVATNVGETVGEDVAENVAEDVVDEVVKKVTDSVKKSIVKALGKLSTKAAQDSGKIGDLVDTAVDKAVGDVGTTVGNDASSALKKVLTDTLTDALKDSTKSQVINGINGVKAAAYGAARGAVSGLGSSIAGSSDLVDGILTMMYGDDQSKWPSAAKDIATAIQAVLAILATLFGEGVVGNVGNAAKSTLAEIGGKVADFAERNATKITAVQTVIQALAQGGSAAAGIAGGIAENSAGLAQQDQDNFLAQSGLAQFLLNFTSQMSTNDRDQVNEAMKTISSEIANIVQSRGKEEDFLANVSNHG